MGFPVSYASALPKLFLSAAISVVALKEICCSFLQSLGLCRDQDEAPAALWTFDPHSEADFYSTMLLLQQQQQQQQQQNHTTSSIVRAIQASLPSLPFHPHLQHLQHLHRHQEGVPSRHGAHLCASSGSDCATLCAHCHQYHQNGVFHRNGPHQCPSFGANSATLCVYCHYGDPSNALTNNSTALCAPCHHGPALNAHSVASAHDNHTPEPNLHKDLRAHDLSVNSNVSSAPQCHSHVCSNGMSQCHGTNGHDLGLLHNSDTKYPQLCHDDNNKDVRGCQLGGNDAIDGGDDAPQSNGNKPTNGNDDVGMPQCAVCLSELRDGQEVRQLPLCCHLFHTECIDGWLHHNQRTCPLCRASLVSDEVAKQLERLQEEEISQEFASWFSSYQEEEGGYHDALFFLPTPLHNQV